MLCTTTPPDKMAAVNLDAAKVECSNDVTCTRFYRRCAKLHTPTATSPEEYYKCTTASLIGSTKCGSKLYEKSPDMTGTIPSLISMLNEC